MMELTKSDQSTGLVVIVAFRTVYEAIQHAELGLLTLQSDQVVFPLLSFTPVLV